MNVLCARVCVCVCARTCVRVSVGACAYVLEARRNGEMRAHAATSCTRRDFTFWDAQCPGSSVGRLQAKAETELYTVVWAEGGTHGGQIASIKSAPPMILHTAYHSMPHDSMTNTRKFRLHDAFPPRGCSSCKSTAAAPGMLQEGSDHNAGTWS